MVRAGVIKLLEYPPDRQGYTPKIVYRKMIKFPCQLVEILLLIILVAHVDLFEHSSSPSERNIKRPKTGGS